MLVTLGEKRDELILNMTDIFCVSEKVRNILLFMIGIIVQLRKYKNRNPGSAS